MLIPLDFVLETHCEPICLFDFFSVFFFFFFLFLHIWHTGLHGKYLLGPMNTQDMRGIPNFTPTNNVTVRWIAHFLPFQLFGQMTFSKVLSRSILTLKFVPFFFVHLFPLFRFVLLLMQNVQRYNKKRRNSIPISLSPLTRSHVLKPPFLRCGLVFIRFVSYFSSGFGEVNRVLEMNNLKDSWNAKKAFQFPSRADVKSEWNKIQNKRQKKVCHLSTPK